MRYTHVDSPIGRLLLVGRPGRLAGLYVADHEGCRAPEPTWTEDAEPFAGVVAQLEEYFEGRRTVFDLDLELEGTPFQRTVWAALQDIPYGETRGYGQLARAIGRPTASRAVGAANGSNPISIIVPCHRVIGADGSLTGYGWGTERKSWLLDHERAQASLFG
ncbi:MAG: methylated-DNA (protein)-cysteine S-methyltransferase [Actinomycetia bacterium]|nr:methylated-DNA (protein)-cysteine S-methyltransferase [Actinomycetes bacterium]